MLRVVLALSLVLTPFLAGGSVAAAQPTPIPLPEHPRPDFQRAEWLNLNGTWDFRFDPANEGVENRWFEADERFDEEIVVPFSWAAPLSGQTDQADVGWYAREVTVPAEWAGKRVFVTIGAADWITTVWIDGHELGTHKGGYTPFSFELTPHVTPGQTHRLVIRVDDTHAQEMLEGKQGYGAIRGIWQTVYLDARGSAPLEFVHFTPDVQGESVNARIRLLEPAAGELRAIITLPGGRHETTIPAGASDATIEIPIESPRLWTLDDPHLYEATVRVEGDGIAPDEVSTYFGMREISVVDLPGTDYRYVALNGEPIYLQLALDQGYHPEGFYTFPSDEFVRDEFLRARQIGLNGLRIHVKIDSPRKLYWADRLGMLVMADVPNSWGEPSPPMQVEIEHALRGMIARDYNHPSIFAWVPFNETWGLHTEVGEDEYAYLPETQEWVASVYDLAKSLDPSRLVEDNSVCCGQGHTRTDINSWHDYRPGWAWDEKLDEATQGTYPGSSWNFEDGYVQADQPNINSEFGNVWGYEGSTGDVDWSWDYHRAIDAFRRHPKISGWLYTEHHDVINEWNGYWRYDRSEKFTGIEELVPGMSLRDLHAPMYVALGGDLSESAAPASIVQVPLFASFLDDGDYGNELTLDWELYGWNDLGRREVWSKATRSIPYRPWMAEELAPLDVMMPNETAVAVLAVRLKDATGHTLSSNFKTFVVSAGGSVEREIDGRAARIRTIDPSDFTDSRWSEKQWEVLDGLKVNGAGSGYFEYRIPWRADLDPDQTGTVRFIAELGAKQCFDKDCNPDGELDDNYMLGGGTHSPHRNPNAYPMTDETRFPSAVRVRVNGVTAGTVDLPDDPADHRGILSWHSQLRDRRLREAGSYGYLVDVAVPAEALQRAAADGEIVLRLEVDEALPGGLAVYGRRFGRYPLDPTVLFVLNRN